MSGHRALFTIAALWNWTISLGTLVVPQLVYRISMPVEAPENLAMTYLFMGLVAIFGLGYFWASRDFDANRAVIRLGVAGKTTVFAMACVLLAQRQIGIPFFALAVGDLVFAILFVRALRQTRGRTATP